MNINLFGDHNSTDFSFMLSQLGKTVTINNVSRQALITNTALQNYDDKRITTLDSFSRGDIVIYNNTKYMVISEQNDKRYNKYKGIMRRLPFTIIFNHNCVYSIVDAYIEAITYGIKTNDFIFIPTGTINVHMQDNEAANTIKLGDRFIVRGRAYKVTGIDKVDRKGICTITADVDLIDSATDDLINDVADGKACTVTINTPADSLMESSQTLQLDYTAPANQTVLFESSKPSVATINTSGLITAIAEGKTTIKATLANNPQFTDSITVTVKLKDNYKINVTTDKSSLLYNESANITVQVLNNGVATTQESITFSLVYANMTTPVPTTIVELVNIQNRTVNVHNINTGIPEDIYLKVTLNKDTSIIGFIPLHLDYYRPVAKTITISGSSTITSQATGTWTSKVNPNQEDVTWSLFADNQTNTTNKATIQSFTGTSVTLKAATVSSSVPAGYFQLKATLKSDNSIVAWYRIQLKSLF
ncbi:Ig-like domain-containing protein [Paenibacillus campi]|uniref:Ig-like domain-containing protein n=1 Tax=Paenibacillus campi TaxID=3106031 RepID=UPI002AFF221E|nr:Ig-like domain-containing protein [Paenibacillus sp. SGZ-1014]